MALPQIWLFQILLVASPLADLMLVWAIVGEGGRLFAPKVRAAIDNTDLVRRSITPSSSSSISGAIFAFGLERVDWNLICGCRCNGSAIGR